MFTGLWDNMWIVGGLAVLAVGIQSVVVAIGAVRRLVQEKIQDERAAALLEFRIAAATRQLEAAQQKDLAWGGWRKFEIVRKEVENEVGDICSFYLAPHDRKAIPAFEPGQYLTFQVTVPGEDKPIVRCYSLSDAPKPGQYRVTIKKLPPPKDSNHPPGRVSNFFHDHLKPGDIVDVKAPSGRFVLDKLNERPVVLIGGGVGVTPVLSMLNAIIDCGHRRETWFFYGTRHAGELAMKEHLRGIAERCPHVHLQICCNAPRPQDVAGRDYHQAEHVSVGLFKRLLPSNNYDFFICGPPVMMDAIIQQLQDWGVPQERIFKEAFGPTHARKPDVAKVAEAQAVAGAIPVTFSKSGKKCLWAAPSGTLLELARANGVAIAAGCEQGDCGTCQIPIRAGEVAYVKKPGFKYEGGTCLTCVSIPKGPVELDA